MLANVICREQRLNAEELAKISYLLVIIPKGKNLPRQLLGASILNAVLKRRNMTISELEAQPITAELGQGGLAAWVMLDFAASAFVRQSAICKALGSLFSENPASIDIVLASEKLNSEVLEDVVYTALVNGKSLVSAKDKPGKSLKKITVHGVSEPSVFKKVRAVAEGNFLCRALTVLPANQLSPTIYRGQIAALAKKNGWQRQEFKFDALKKMGAGAFCAVAQGSEKKDAAIVKLMYRGKNAKKTIALIGKGICFDTGGHNLKNARGMLDMHKDMNGSAVALGILLAASQLKLPINIDCWLAIAENHISPTAYKQSDVITALNGTSIEIIHTDAEGRMVLADTLTLASKQNPELMIDFATLTGSMIYSLGTRYSGIFSNDEKSLNASILAGKSSGERVNPFPLDEDYEEALKSEVADIKQCLIAGEADHILAARFLSKFVAEIPWVHMDLSASQCEGGLGAISGEITGFGVKWGIDMLIQQISKSLKV